MNKYFIKIPLKFIFSHRLSKIIENYVKIPRCVLNDTIFNWRSEGLYSAISMGGTLQRFNEPLRSYFFFFRSFRKQAFFGSSVK